MYWGGGDCQQYPFGNIEKRIKAVFLLLIMKSGTECDRTETKVGNQQERGIVLCLGEPGGEKTEACRSKIKKSSREINHKTMHIQ